MKNIELRSGYMNFEVNNVGTWKKRNFLLWGCFECFINTHRLLLSYLGTWKVLVQDRKFKRARSEKSNFHSPWVKLSWWLEELCSMILTPWSWWWVAVGWGRVKRYGWVDEFVVFLDDGRKFSGLLWFLGMGMGMGKISGLMNLLII